jgi:ATP-binding cassette subfamily B protein
MPSNQRSITKKVHQALSQVSYWPQTLRLIWHAAPFWTITWLILLVVQGTLPIASVYLTKLLVDSLVEAIRAGSDWQKMPRPIIFLGATALVLLLSDAIQSAIDWVRAAQSELVQDYINNLIHEQSSLVDLAFYESPEFYDSLDQARSEASSRPVALLESSGSLVQNGITSLAMAGVLMRYSTLLPLLLLISLLPTLIMMLRFDRRYHEWWERVTSDRRMTQYYDLMLTDGYAAAEMRLFGLSTHFRSAYQALRRRLRTQRLGQLRKQSVAKFGTGALGLLISVAIMFWMVWRVLLGQLTLGDLALFYQAFQRGQGLMRSLIGSAGQILANSLYLGNLYKFLGLRPQIVDPLQPRPVPVELKQGITFRRVTFRYPGSERYAVRDFNLHVPAGQIVALVGANGAGKTTLFKLLCRFYDPESGTIELDGTDIREFSTSELRRAITSLCQFPLTYNATAGQNIALGDVAACPNQSMIESAAKSAKADEIIARLPQKYNTMLGKWFANGVQLSGGEWQRVAMARAYIRNSPIILLDEPTSSMDSWTEADWFARFRKLTHARTAILITHRFTIAMRADLIHVMGDGLIIESGTHHELISKGGTYAESWREQMSASFEGRVDGRGHPSPVNDLTN